jgi:subtilase family serine protease
MKQSAKIQLVLSAALAAAAVMGVTSSASSQVLGSQPTPVLRSGNVFHRAVCAAAQPGMARCHAHVVTDSRGTPLSTPAQPSALRRTNLPQGYGPSDLRSAYAITATGSPTTVIAIVDAYGYTNAEADLATYRSTFGLPACSSASGCFTKVNQNGSTTGLPAQDTGWAQETALDLDMASAMCPNCRILLVEASTTAFTSFGAAENTAARLGAKVISNSYGGGEGGSQSIETAYNHPGVAITVSTGDDGYGVEFPASSPHVTAVGGTSLLRAANARGWSETAWADAGSGCSTVYAKPAWQTDPLCTRRMAADVSAIADPQTGVAVYGPVNSRSSAWQIYGGTSVAAPLIGGVYAVNGGTVNYGSNPYANLGALNDVTSGTNGRCGGTYFCTAGTGYDGPTGLGTPKGSAAF